MPVLWKSSMAACNISRERRTLVLFSYKIKETTNFYSSDNLLKIKPAKRSPFTWRLHATAAKKAKQLWKQRSVPFSPASEEKCIALTLRVEDIVLQGDKRNHSLLDGFCQEFFLVWLGHHAVGCLLPCTCPGPCNTAARSGLCKLG